MFTLEDHLKLTSELADLSIAKHMCIKDGEKLAIDTQDGCIKYNKNKLEYIAQRWGLDAAKGVWLHEMGHLKQIKNRKFNNMHTFTHVDMKRLELEADEYTGCQMKKQVLNHQTLIGYMKSSYIPDSKHGTLEQRINAIQRGYDGC
jgi:predicted metalloprotease